MKKILTLLLFAVVFCLQANAQNEPNQQGRYYVQLQNGQIVYADKLKFKTPIFKQDYFLLNDSMQFRLDAVKAYQNADGYYARVGYGSRANAFAKRILHGPRISKYYTTTYDYYNMGYSPYGYGMGAPSRRRVYFFSKDDGPLQSFNYGNLQEALSDNASSMVMLKRYKSERFLTTGLSVLGAGIAAFGVYSSSNNSNGSLSPAVYAGVGVAAIPFVLQLFQKDKLTQAIELYNYQIKQ
ncbi:hypothetical protein [Pontibacter vulgaris]|uniref:hypothetical protein n=1 Tax=Pontibacter vulgaris TaxID=2905679 RepID=UPI001FA76ECC|nr:hypothetical protein [Pontibacter vulgaris]